MLNIDLKDEDLLVLFNTATPLSSPKVTNHKNKIIFCRANKDNWWWGKGNLEKYNKLFKEIYVLYGWDYSKQMPYLREMQKKYSNLKSYSNFNDDIVFTGHPRGTPNMGSPQSGFVGYCIMKKKYPDADIKLVGFTRRRNNNIGHSYAWEYEYYKKNKIPII
jgi:hypothetical protein